MPTPRSARAGLCIFLSLLLPCLALATPWEQDSSDIPAWPGATFGVLENGLRYVIIPTQAQKNEVSYRMVVAAGSIEETDTQRGYAHFIEHMAFRSSKHFRGDQKMQWLERVGARDGADVNAETKYDATVYKFDVPTNDPAFQEGTLLMLADISSELLFDKDEMDVERNVVLGEALTGHSAGADHYDSEIEFLYEGTLYPHRKPIGTEDAVAGATPGQLQAFYDTWYRPELITLVVVGDVDPGAIETSIKTRFGAITPRSPSATPPTWGPATRASVPATRVIPGEVGMHLTLGNFYERPLLPANLELWRSDLRAKLAEEMLSLRLDGIARGPESPVTRAYANSNIGFGPSRQEEINLRGAMVHWKDALDIADQELRRALKYGFTKDELSRAEIGFMDVNRRVLNNAEKLLNLPIANYAAEQIQARQVIASPAYSSTFILDELPKVTLEECQEALHERWDGAPRFVLLRDGAQSDGIGPDTLTYELNRSSRIAVLPLSAAAQDRTFPYAPAEKSAPVTAAALDSSGAWHGQFSNGVRLNVKPTQNLADTIHVRLRLGSGVLAEPANRPGLATFSAMATFFGGIKKMTAVDLRDYFLRNGIRLSVETDARSAVVLDTTAPTAGAVPLFALLAAYLHDAAFEDSTQAQVLGALNDQYFGRRQSTSGLIQLKLGQALMGGDLRFSFPAPSAYGKYTMQDAAIYMRPILASADLEVSIVGPIGIDEAREAVGRTMGQLHPRMPRLLPSELRQPKPTRLPSRTVSQYDANVPDARAIISLCWKVPSPVNPADSPEIYLLSRIFAERVKTQVRVEQGRTYSPWTTFNWMAEVPAYAFCACIVDTKPAYVDSLEKATREVAMEIARNGVTLDEVITQRVTLLKGFEADSHDDLIIMDDIDSSQTLPALYAATLNQPQLLGACTPESLTARARQIFRPENLATFILVPRGQAAK